MISNIDFVITTLCVLLSIVSFGLGYFFANTRAENRFYNAMVKNQKMKERMMKNTRVIKVDERQMPQNFLKFLEDIEKEIEEEDKKDGK